MTAPGFALFDTRDRRLRHRLGRRRGRGRATARIARERHPRAPAAALPGGERGAAAAGGARAPSTTSARCCAASTSICPPSRSTWTACRPSTAASTRPRAPSRPARRVSYGEIAAGVGAPGSARAVGQALGRNPFAIVVPCHRVLAAGGRLGGFSANGGASTKLRMLSIEGARAAGQRAPLRRRRHPRLRPARRGRPPARGRPGAGADHRRRRPVHDRAQADAEHLRGARRGDRLPAAERQGRGDDLRPRLRAVPARPGRSDGGAHPARLGREAARRRPLARRSSLALRDLAARELAAARSRRSPTRARMDDDAIIERLTAVRGIGRWTVEMLLDLPPRPARRPAGGRLRRSQGLRRRAPQARAARPRTTLERRGARWQPYRTVASWYLWRAVELDKTSPRRAQR